jgi:hypothetical protein
VDWCYSKDTCSCGSPRRGCPYDEGCLIVNQEVRHVEGDHRSCRAEDCDIARTLYPAVRAAGVALATPTEVAIVSCWADTIRTHGTQPPNKARHARTAIGKRLGIPVEDFGRGVKAWNQIKGHVLVVCSEGHLT